EARGLDLPGGWRFLPKPGPAHPPDRRPSACYPMHAVESRRFVRFSTVDGEFIAQISCATHKNSGVHFVPSPSGGTSPCRVGSAATSSWVVDAMRLSRGFIPTLKQTPNEAQIASHRLMLRAGLVRQ